MRIAPCVMVLAVGSAEAGSTLVDTFDEFTDERVLSVVIKAQDRSAFTDKGRAAVFLCVGNGRSGLGVNTGLGHFHLGSTIPVKWRLDDRPPQSVNANRDTRSSTASVNHTGDVARDAARSERMVVQVGDDRIMRFDLWEARADMQEYVRRCGLTLPDPSRRDIDIGSLVDEAIEVVRRNRAGLHGAAASSEPGAGQAANSRHEWQSRE